MRWIALALLVGCAGSVVPKGPGVYVYKDTTRTKYVKNGVIIDGKLSEVVKENYQAKTFAIRSERLGLMAILPALVSGACFTWYTIEFSPREPGNIGRQAGSAGCALASLLTMGILLHASKASQIDAINQYNNDLLK